MTWTTTHNQSRESEATETATIWRTAMKKIYLVRGRTGEYSDSCEWYVCAYESKESADAHAEALGKQTAHSDQWSWEKRFAFKTSLDRGFQCDYNGTSYEVVEVDFYSSFKEYVASNPPTTSALDDDELPEESA